MDPEKTSGGEADIVKETQMWYSEIQSPIAHTLQVPCRSLFESWLPEEGGG